MNFKYLAIFHVYLMVGLSTAYAGHEFFSIPASAFESRSENIDERLTPALGGFGHLWIGMKSVLGMPHPVAPFKHAFVAPLQLPNGSMIRNMKCYVQDNDTRGDFTSRAGVVLREINPLGANGTGIRASKAIFRANLSTESDRDTSTPLTKVSQFAHHTVDNQTKQYILYLEFVTTNLGRSLNFRGCTVQVLK